MRKPPDVVIVLDGGLVQDVFTNNSGLRIVSIDWDATNCDPDDELALVAEDGNRAWLADWKPEPLSEIGTTCVDLLQRHDAGE